MSRTFRQLALGSLVVAALLGGAVPALAAPVSWSSVDVVLHADLQSPLLIVSGTVPEGTQFPVDGVLTVPTGAQLQWVGEVLGGPVSEDPELQPQVTSSGGSDVYTFTMNKGPSAQVEALLPGALTGSGEAQQASVSWVAPQDLPAASVQVRIPVGSKLGELPADAKLEPGPTGYSYVKRTIQNVKAGDTLALQFSFVPGSVSGSGVPPSAAGAPSSATSALVPTLLVVGTAAALIALFVGVRRQMARKQLLAAATVAEAESGGPSDSPRASGDDGTQRGASEESPESEPAQGGEDVGARGRRWSPATLITVGVIVVLAAGALVAVNASTKPAVADGKITQQIAQVDQCTSATFPLRLPEGTDVEKAAEELFGALRSASGVGMVTVYTDDPRIEVGFCESNTTEEAVRAALAPTGLLAQ